MMNRQTIDIPHFGDPVVPVLREKAIPEPGAFNVTIDVAYDGCQLRRGPIS
ncbi:hypothetical protein [Paenibacillus sp. SI8]|uniref:hypothetical protein n=1 Tax=unclassified Paenibacillus TaxID=185978 RepID=UPI003464EE8E